jgi:hypothetical protein
MHATGLLFLLNHVGMGDRIDTTHVKLENSKNLQLWWEN